MYFEYITFEYQGEHYRVPTDTREGSSILLPDNKTLLVVTRCNELAPPGPCEFEEHVLSSGLQQLIATNGVTHVAKQFDAVIASKHN